MPTKPNRAGQQQNYVPAGNGDASGEYGDNATGSNIHITIKQDDSSKIEKPSKPVEAQPKTNHGEKIASYIKEHSKMSKASLQTISNEISTGSSEAQELLSKALDKHNYSFKIGKSSYYQPGGEGGMVLANSSMSSEYRNPGETFWHENGHLIDFSNTEFEFGRSRSSQTLSVTYRSEKDNKTLFETVVEEGGKFANSYEAIQDIQDEKKALIKKYLEEASIDEKKIDELYQKRQDIEKEIANDPEYIKVKEAYTGSDLAKKLMAGEITYSEYTEATKQSRENVNTVYRKLQEEKKYNEVADEYTKLNTARVEAKMKASKEFTKKYGSLSDMLDAATNGYNNLGCGAHGRGYWRSDGYSVAHEFFAEAFSAYARNSKTELDAIRKYYPRSVEIMEEIVRKYK